MKLSPHLIVKDAQRAIDFYRRALGAEERSCFVDAKIGGRVVHAELAIAGAKLTLSEESRDWGNEGPSSLGGSPVVLTLAVDDADAVGARMTAAGAEVVFPIADQFYGERQGRLRDPFGHLWLITQRIEALTNEEVQRRVDAYEPST